MLTEFMLVSGWAFWIVLGLIIAFEIFLVALAEDGTESHTFATALAVLALVCAVLFTDAFDGVRLWAFAALAALYLAAGAGWAIWKWYGFVRGRYAKERASYDGSAAINERQTWEDYAKRNRPKAADYKARLTTWMALWPLSALWDLLRWPRRAFVWMYERLSSLFDRISQRVFSE